MARVVFCNECKCFNKTFLSCNLWYKTKEYLSDVKGVYGLVEKVEKCPRTMSIKKYFALNKKFVELLRQYSEDEAKQKLLEFSKTI